MVASEQELGQGTARAGGETAKEQVQPFGGAGYIYNVNCGDAFTGVYVSKLAK